MLNFFPSDLAPSFIGRYVGFRKISGVSVELVFPSLRHKLDSFKYYSFTVARVSFVKYYALQKKHIPWMYVKFILNIKLVSLQKLIPCLGVRFIFDNISVLLQDYLPHPSGMTLVYKN